MLIVPGMREAVMRLLKRLDGGLRGGSQRCLSFLEDRLAPFTLAVLLVVLFSSTFCWDSYSYRWVLRRSLSGHCSSITNR